MCCEQHKRSFLYRSKTQRRTTDQVRKDQIKVKTDRLRIKKSIKGQNNSDLDRYGSFKPRFTESDSRSDWRELEMEPGFRQGLKN